MISTNYLIRVEAEGVYSLPPNLEAVAKILV